MWFRLALALGMSVADAQKRIDSAEFAEWVAYYGVEPFGIDRDRIFAAQNAQAIAFGPLKDPKSIPFEKFMLPLGEAKKQTADDMEAQLMAWATKVNTGRKRRGRNGNNRNAGRSA